MKPRRLVSEEIENQIKKQIEISESWLRQLKQEDPNQKISASLNTAKNDLSVLVNTTLDNYLATESSRETIIENILKAKGTPTYTNEEKDTLSIIQLAPDHYSVARETLMNFADLEGFASVTQAAKDAWEAYKQALIIDPKVKDDFFEKQILFILDVNNGLLHDSILLGQEMAKEEKAQDKEKITNIYQHLEANQKKINNAIKKIDTMPSLPTTSNRVIAALGRALRTIGYLLTSFSSESRKMVRASFTGKIETAKLKESIQKLNRINKVIRGGVALAVRHSIRFFSPKANGPQNPKETQHTSLPSNPNKPK